MRKRTRVLISIVGFAALLAAARQLASHGTYGWTLFVLIPAIAGALGTWSFQPRTWGHVIRIGAMIGVLECCLFLLLGLEGFMCVLMALPIVVPLTIIGSALAYWAGTFSKVQHSAAMILFVPVSMFFDGNAKPPIYSVTTSLEVNATPERVWRNVVAFPAITAQPDWVLRTGVAYPIRTDIDGTAAGAPRSCDLSTGTVQERVIIWDEPHLLRFVVTATPPAMREIGLYGPIYPRHLNGYYISKEGQFSLTPLPGGRTLVVGTSWYQHGLWPAEYWHWWSDMVVHHIHQRVLNHVRELSERKDS